MIISTGLYIFNKDQIPHTYHLTIKVYKYADENICYLSNFLFLIQPYFIFIFIEQINNTMLIPVDKLFLAIAIICLPNLYYRAEYNLPLMLFCFGVWQSLQYRAATVFLLIFSWVIDIYCLLRSISQIQSQKNSPKIVLAIQITTFVLKIVTVIILLCYDRHSLEAINPKNLCSSFNRFLYGSKRSDQVKE